MENRESGTLSGITRELLKIYSFPPKKKLGQHFLIDTGVLDRLLEAADLKKNDLVIEIGTGLGTVTKELAERSGTVVSIEYDKILFQIAGEYLGSAENIELIRDDILEVNLSRTIKKYKKNKNLKIVGNLPYYISAPIISKLIELKPKPDLIVLTLQKEVAERIVAKPGTKEYGSFSIFVQFYAEPEIHSYAPKSAFYPQPQVSSAIIILKPRTEPIAKVKNEKLFFNIVRAAFGQRRKMLRAALKKIKGISQVLAEVGIDEKRRGETLSIEEFTLVENALSNP
ncbi:MAG: 16S rRNA (adenine(1518)-N(6)/adenine(1519)-N(6))-dimethyltransferase RsmA [Candidatus Saganbacteria bacterium]|nr:16S rRNA (adenine(1518)-N(6)/adenine(1519)-N(6))-dimethyltransferase RsmA [Candidatus Saganbacteria bacterium]